MKGYKAILKNGDSLHGHEHYEIGDIKEIKGELKLCWSGFHFCKEVFECFLFYNRVECDIYEVEALGEVMEGEHKCCASKIKILRKLSEEETKEQLDNTWKKFVSDKDYNIRKLIARQGNGLDILVNDEDRVVRAEVAQQGYKLDVLINDEYWWIRRIVARQGYGLDILVNDRNEWVRVAVAEQGYGLDILINDRNEEVRREVARQGFGLDILINDEDWLVNIIAEGKMEF